MARCNREECLHLRVAAEFAVRKGTLNVHVLNRRLPTASSDGAKRCRTLQERLTEARQALRNAELELGMVRALIRQKGLPLDYTLETVTIPEYPNITTTPIDDERDSVSSSDDSATSDSDSESGWPI